MMNEVDRIAEDCLDCGICVEDCEFLSSYCDSPRELAEKFQAGFFREEPMVPYSCNDCRLCQELCPEELDIGKMCRELRQELVKEGLGPLPGHRFVRKNQDFSASDSFTLAQPDPAQDKCERVFFPGCTLSGYSPSLTLKTYDYLRQKLPGTGIVLGCCGEQTLCLGDEARFQEVLAETLNMIKQLGTSEVIVTCPLCYKTFKAHAPELNLTFVTETLQGVGLPEGVKVNGQTFSLHDSCSARWEKGIQDSVRALVKETGHQIEEMEYSREKTRCCGLGGMVPFVNMELGGKITKRRVEEASHDILTYCASCREAFAPYKPAIHILDLIFNPDWKEDKAKAPKTGKARREEQAKLKTLLQEKFGKGQ